MVDCEAISYDALRGKYETTKKELSEAEESIRRLTGREPDQLFGVSGAAKWRNQQAQFPNRPFVLRKRPFPKDKSDEELSSPDEEEESPDEDSVTPAKKPALQSTVVATIKDVKSRKDTIQEQNVDSKVTERNRRMFGMIMGTLQKFQHEEKKRIPQVLKRAEIEQKVEAAAEEEKERIKKEKEELFLTRREKQTQLRCLEKKLEIAEVHQAWENSHMFMKNFILTRTSPQIFFSPSVPNAVTNKRLEDTKSKIIEKIEEHRAKVEKEVLEIEEMYKKNSLPCEKENNSSQEENEKQEIPSDDNQETSMPAESEISNVPEEEERTNQSLEISADQEFEPIYDE